MKIIDLIRPKKGTSPTPLSEGAWVLFSQLSSASSNILTTLLIAIELGPTSYGSIVIPLIISTTVSQTLGGSFGTALLRQIPNFENVNQSVEINKAFTFFLICVPIISAITTLLLIILISNISNINLLLIISAYSLTNSHNLIFMSSLAARFQRSLSAHGIFLEAILKILLTMLVARYGGMTELSAFTILLIASSLTLIFYQISRHDEIILSSVRQSSLKAILSVAGPSVIWGLFTAAHAASDRWAISFFRSAAETGQYNLSFQFSYSLFAIGSSILISAYTPFLFKDYTDKLSSRKDFWTRRSSIMSKSIISTGLIISFFYCLLEHASFSLLPGEFYAGPGVIPLLLIAGAFFSAGQIWSIILQGHHRMTTLAIIKIISACIGIIANIVGAIMAGASGVALAMAITSAFYFWLTKNIALNQTV